MQISSNDNIMNLLKTYYKDGVENLMFRNSPVVKEVTKERVEGKEQAFSTMVGRGGAVGGNFVKAKKAAKKTGAQTAEFKVTPGQLFSVYTMNAKEVQASKTLKGAYAPIAGAKMFAATEAFRKTVAFSFYGDGYGTLYTFTGSPAAIQTEADYKLTLPSHAIMAIDIGSELVLKATKDAAPTEGDCILTVKEINGNEVSFSASKAATPKANQVLCLDGSVDGSGNPTLPVGLAGWLPTIGDRKTSDWTNFMAAEKKAKFFNVDRSINPDRLAGAFYNGKADKTITDAIENLMQKVRRQGSVADLIVMNDNDFKRFAKEVETTNTFYTATSTKAKKQANVGFDSLSASFSTNYIENIYDDPYCPEGTAYILDREYLRLWSYTNMDIENDGVAGNEAGKADVMEAGNEGNAEKPYGLVIDDFLNIAPGEDSEDGPVTAVSIMAYFSWVITNPSTAGVALLPAAGK